jgi:hypothetical protein
MNNTNYIPIAVASLLAFFLLVLADLVPFWMPMMGEMFALLFVVILLIVWVGFVVKEHAKDEREMFLKMRSGRVAYLSGLIILTIALILQGLTHTIDPWIAVALAVMVFAKLATWLFVE